MTREEYIEFANALKNNYTIDFDKLPEFCDMAISALSAEGEYIKKEEALKALHDFWDECIGYDGSGTEMMLDNESVINSLPTYSFPDSVKTDTAKPESDLISRTQAINDYAQCFADEYGMDCGEMFIGVLHQCPTFPDSAENKGEWIYDKGIENWRCSKCGQAPPPTGYVGNADFMATHFKFCNHCGADMRGKGK